MVLCFCRNIRESDYEDLKSLYERLLQDDVCCGLCLKEIAELVDDLT